MKLKSRIAGPAMALGLALAMSAAPAFGVDPSPPTVATGNVVFPQGTQTSRGSCTGILIGSLWNATKTQGLSNILGPITSSSKGVAGSASDFALVPAKVGECTIDGRVGLLGGTGGVPQTKTITKAGTKLSSTGTRCGNDANGNTVNFELAAVPVGDFEPLQRPLSGKFGYSFSDGSKMDAYVRVQGFAADFADIVWLTGIVTKGEAVGSTVGGNVWFNPVFKTSLATTFFDTIGSLPLDQKGRFVTSATSSGTTVTLTVFPSTTGVVVGQSITVSLLSGTGVNAAAVNGTYAVTATTPSTITYSTLLAPGVITDGAGLAITGADKHNFVDPINGLSLSYAPGWGGSTAYSTGIALGCLAQAIPMGIGITTIAIGGGSISPLLGATSSGIHFLT